MLEDPVEAVALFRYGLIAEALNPRLTPAERGWLVRELASRAHLHPDGSMRTYARGSIDRWIRAWRASGLDGLRPVPRSDTGQVRRHPELLAEAAALRAERPARSAAHIADILRARYGIWVGDVLTGPFVPHPRVAGSKRAKLFVLVDDYSRLLVHGRWTAEENTRAGQDVLRAAIARR